METVYLTCSIIGGLLFCCQMFLNLLGGDHDAGHHDLSHEFSDDFDHGSTWFVGVLSFRTIVAAILFFGLAGMAGTRSGWDGSETLLVAGATGIGAFVVVAFLIKSLHKLKSDGTLHIARAVGKKGTVYLKVPGSKAGMGKVTVVVQNRTVEFQAVTSADELPTGSSVVVLSVVGPETVEVAPATSSEPVYHA